MRDLIDFDKALQRIGGDAEFLKELLTDLMEQIDDNIEILKQTIQSNDYENLKSLAHGLKGVSANLNVDRIAKHFLQLEQQAEEKNTAGATDLLELIIQDRKELQQFTSNINASR